MFLSGGGCFGGVWLVPWFRLAQCLMLLVNSRLTIIPILIHFYFSIKAMGRSLSSIIIGMLNSRVESVELWPSIKNYGFKQKCTN